MAATAFAGLVITTASASAANVIVNGDFETGDLTGWTGGAGTTVSSTDPLAGVESAIQVYGFQEQLYQRFTPITTAATASFIFQASDPGGAGDRSLNFVIRDSVIVSGQARHQINLRLVDLDADGDGDVQIYDGGWQTIFTDAVVFGETTSLSLTLNSYGTGATYDLNVGGNTANGLSFFQNGFMTDFAEVAFLNEGLSGSTTLKIDNVSVVPEPSTTALIGLGGLALILRRCR